MTASDRSKAIARAIADHLGFRPSVHRWESDHFPGLGAAILVAAGWPSNSLTAAFTLDLTDEPLGLDEPEYELAIVGPHDSVVDQLLGDTAVRVRRHIFVPAPGHAVFHGMAPSFEALAVKHLAAIQPVTPELRFDLPPVRPAVALLQLVPVSDAELAVFENEGPEELISRIRGAGLDLHDLNRPVLEALT